MSFFNTVHDLTTQEIAAIRAADVAADLAAKGGTPDITGDETTVLPRLIQAMRGRGCSRILNRLLEDYHNASTAQHFVSPAQATACGGVDGKVQGAF